VCLFPHTSINTGGRAARATPKFLLLSPLAGERPGVRALPGTCADRCPYQRTIILSYTFATLILIHICYITMTYSPQDRTPDIPVWRVLPDGGQPFPPGKPRPAPQNSPLLGGRDYLLSRLRSSKRLPDRPGNTRSWRISVWPRSPLDTRPSDFDPGRVTGGGPKGGTKPMV
jgi:hypothetical protein